MTFKWSLIRAYNLPFLYNEIITTNVSTKYSYLKILGIKNMIIIRVVIVEK